MPTTPGRRIRAVLAVLALVLIGFASTSLAANAAARETGPDAVTGPADGSVVVGTVVVFSAPSAVFGAGYELRWGTDETVDAETGQLVNVAGAELVATPEYAIVELAETTYYWQVRWVDGGEWTTPQSFTIDAEGTGVQLETFPVEPTTSEATPSASPRTGISGGVWVATASAFAVLFLVIVGLSARQVRRAS